MQPVSSISLKDLPCSLALSNVLIHVWQATLDLPIEQVEKLAQLLSSDEQIRANRFRFQHHQHRFIVSRGILRTLLASYLNADPAGLQFGYSPQGKPFLASPHSSPSDPLAQNLFFNLSHSEGLVLYAFALDRRVGIDLEYLPPVRSVNELAQRFFSPREHATICAFPPEQQQSAFLQIWTYKEAYLKATGEGLMGLKQVEVTLKSQDATAPATLTIHNSTYRSSTWQVMRLEPPTDFVAALAIEGNPEPLVYYRLTYP